MSNLSIRGIDPDLATTLKQQAQASGKSVNQLVLDVLKEHTGHYKKSSSTSNATIWIFFLVSGLRANFRKFRQKLTTNLKLTMSFGNERSID